MIRKFALVLVLTSSPTALIAQPSRRAEIKRIDAYSKGIDKFVQKRKAPDLIFADVSDNTAGSRAKWRRFSSEKTLDKFREQSETYTIAYVWQRNGKIELSNFTLFSDSGDWAKYVYSYFRADGSLARVESELRTFYGHYIATQRRYFDRKGKLIHQSVKYVDLETKKPKKPDPDFISDNSSWKGVDYFKHTKKLPFAHLLKTAAK